MLPDNNTNLTASPEIETHDCYLPEFDVVKGLGCNSEVIWHEDPKTETAKITSLPRIYIASKTIHAPKWRRLRNEGYNIISTWIDETGIGQTPNYTELSIRCIKEIRQSDFLIFYCEEGEIQKGAFIEMGAALAFGIEVRCVVNRSADSNKVFRYHPLSREFSDIYAALENK